MRMPFPRVIHIGVASRGGHFCLHRAAGSNNMKASIPNQRYVQLEGQMKDPCKT